MASQLPQYEKPPVTETVLGLEFRPISTWQTPFFGLFWSKIRDRYNKIAVRPPLPDESGEFGISINFGPMPVRCWFIDESEQWLIQLQNSRFISNWRKLTGNDYPSYQLFRNRFVDHYATFEQLLKDENFPEVHYFQAEVSYINQIEVSGFSELSQIFPIFSGFREGGILPHPQGGEIKIVYPMPDERGRLSIGIHSITNHATARELLQLTVTAKTLIASNTTEAALEALDFSHEWVVNGFTDFTSPEMHKIWKRTQ